MLFCLTNVSGPGLEFAPCAGLIVLRVMYVWLYCTYVLLYVFLFVCVCVCVIVVEVAICPSFV